MTRVLITGAAGFIGGALAARLAREPSALAESLGTPIDTLLLADVHQPQSSPALEGARWLTGDLADPGYIDKLVAQTPDVVFHLASVPGGAAERDPALGSTVNLHGTLRLFERLAQAAKRPPVVVFSSTVAVYGAPLPEQGMNENTPTRPRSSYGAHKLMTEVLLADLSRRGVLDGRSLRLPGIVARPPQAGGHVSAFMSDIIHHLAAGRPYTCPVSAEASCWWMSVRCCVDNLLSAAGWSAEVLDAERDAGRVWQMPVLHATVGELVDALAQRFGPDRHELVTWAPQETVEQMFGRQPLLTTPAARALGLRDDGTLAQLIERALSLYA